jgi:hypothetical protein
MNVVWFFVRLHSAGYHTANVAEQYVHDQLPVYGGFVTAIANLDTTTSADRETFATLNKAIATLADQLAAKDIWAKAKYKEIKSLLGGRAPAVAATTAGPAAAYARKSYNTKHYNYCWSHGYQVGLDSTSTNSTKKADLWQNQRILIV